MLYQPGDLPSGLRHRVWPVAAVALLVSTTYAVPSPSTVSVDQNDPACSDTTGTPFCTLGAAISGASGGEVIDVAPGTYNEGVFVPWDDITIRGAGPGATIVDNQGMGAVFVTVGKVTLEGLTITGGDNNAGPGGGIAAGGITRVIDCVVTGNHASGGGGIAAQQLELLRTEVSGNTADVLGGGGIRGSGLTITDSRIADNLAINDGGGIFLDGAGDVLLVRTTVEGNRALGEGGGIHANVSGLGATALTLSQSTVSDNEADAGLGGGLLTDGVTVTLINTTVSGNRATTGAAITHGDFNGGGLLALRNVTVFGNESSEASGTGGVLVLDSAATAISNSILAGNTNASGPADCEGDLSSEGYNLIQSATCGTFGATDLLGLDPLLQPLADRGGPTQTHALGGNSPAANVGNPATPGSSAVACEPTDQRGIPRPNDGVCDIGAFELVPVIFEDGFESGDLNAWAPAVP